MKKFLALAIVLASLSSANVSAAFWSTASYQESLTAVEIKIKTAKDKELEKLTAKKEALEKAIANPSRFMKFNDKMEEYPKVTKSAYAVTVLAAAVAIYLNRDAIKSKLACCKTKAA